MTQNNETLNCKNIPDKICPLFFLLWLKMSQNQWNTVSVLGQEEGCTVKYTPLPEGVPEREA